METIYNSINKAIGGERGREEKVSQETSTQTAPPPPAPIKKEGLDEKKTNAVAAPPTPDFEITAVGEEAPKTLAEETEVDKEETASVAIKDLGEEQLLEKIKQCIMHADSRKLLVEYYRGIQSATDVLDKENYYKTFFTCLGMLIKIPGEYNQKIFEMSKAMQKKIAISPELEKEMEALLQSQFAAYHKVIAEQDALNQ